MPHRSADDLLAGLETVEAAPRDEGSVRLIVRRPAVDARETLAEAELDPDVGLVGDSWIDRAGLGSDGPHRYAQVTLMNARYAELIAGPRDEWAKAGDQLYVDLDLSTENLPAGTRLALGTAVIELSAEPHTGCAKFSARFGSEALRLANSRRGRHLRLRGANAVIVEAGTVRDGDVIRRIA